MPLCPAASGRSYPNLGQAILLVLLALGLQVASGATAFAIACIALGDVASAGNFIFRPWVLLVVVTVSGALTLALGLRASHEPFRRFFRVHPFSGGLVSAVVITSVGLAILLRECDNGILELVARLLGPDKLLPDIIDLVTAPVGAALLLIVAAPILEEYLYRGLILRGLLQNSRQLTAIVASSLLFGIVHGNVRQFVVGVTIGATFGWWYARTRSVGPSLIGHAVFNSIAWACAQLPAWAADLGLARKPHAVAHEPWWLVLGGAALVALGVRSFNRDAFDLRPDLAWPPAGPSPVEPPVLDQPPLLAPVSDQPIPAVRTEAPVL